jgi:hypothetical protein
MSQINLSSSNVLIAERNNKPKRRIILEKLIFRELARKKELLAFHGTRKCITVDIKSWPLNLKLSNHLRGRGFLF